MQHITIRLLFYLKQKKAIRQLDGWLPGIIPN